MKYEHLFAEHNSPVMLLRFIGGAMMTRERLRLLGIWESASNVAASPWGCPLVPTVASVSLRGCLTSAAFASTSASTFICGSGSPLLNWNGASCIYVDRWGHNDGLSLFAAAPVGWRLTMSIILGVLSDRTGAVTFSANLWCACVNLWL